MRLSALREFCGTTNGTNPHPYDLSTGFDDPNNTEGWDDSHLWHIHLSIYRMHANDESVLLPIADVFAGVTTASSNVHQLEEDDEMKAYVVHDGSNQWWVIRGDCSSRTGVTEATAKKLIAKGTYDTTNPFDQVSLVHIPVAK